MIEQIADQLAAGKAVSHSLTGGGRLHIERQLPFLCLYRAPHDRHDEGTEKMVLGQAAYFISSADPVCQQEQMALLHRIAAQQSRLFGTFLIVELWSGTASPEEGELPGSASFHLHAPHRHAPNATLEALENGLQGIKLRRRASRVEISFDDAAAPPSLPPLLSDEQATQLNCIMVGIEISPVYRDPQRDAILPFALRTMRRGITHALKKGLYRFSHDETEFRPRHYHELGSRALTKKVWEVDRRLAEISEAFDLLLHVTPMNAADAWRAFERSDYRETPEFHYRPRSVDPALLKRELYHIPLERIEDPTLGDLFDSKRQELDRQITLLDERDKATFLHGSIQLFGAVDKALLDTAQQILRQTVAPAGNEHTEILDAEQFAAQARDELDYYRSLDPSLQAKVEVRDDITGILVSHGNFLIGRDAHVSTARLQATLNHEIGTHVLTYHNGKRQPFQQLYAGMAGYEELQEGLAVFAEYLTGGLSLPRLQLLAGRVVAVDSIIAGASFIETFTLLHHDHGFHPFTAFTMTMRVYRGGGYTKDVVYLRGLVNLLDYLAAEEGLELLYYGKIAMAHLHLIEELRWRNVLAPIALMPRYLETPEAQQRLSAFRAQPDIMHILENLEYKRDVGK